jgi:hypothetical protein
LAATQAALGAMLPVIDVHQDRADGAYAAFVLAGASVASSRMALWSAPSLPLRPRSRLMPMVGRAAMRPGLMRWHQSWPG